MARPRLVLNSESELAAEAAEHARAIGTARLLLGDDIDSQAALEDLMLQAFQRGRKYAAHVMCSLAALATVDDARVAVASGVDTDEAMELAKLRWRLQCLWAEHSKLTI